MVAGIKREQMVSQKKYSLGPFAVLTFIYFIVGFLTTVNGQFQGPMKVAFLSQTEELRNTLTTMISFFFFLGYLLNSSLGGKWVNARGYKVTMLRALVIMVAGLVMYSLSSWLAVHCGDASVRIADDVIPCGYFVFLLGSFLMGTSAAILQVVINPYVSAYELPGTQPVQRMNQTYIIYYIFNLVQLQPSNEINLKRCIQIWQLFKDFLNAVFSQTRDARLHDLVDAGRLYGLAHRDDLRGAAPAAGRGFLKLASDARHPGGQFLLHMIPPLKRA